MAKTLYEEVADKLGKKKEVRSDGVLKLCNGKLYVTDVTYYDGKQTSSKDRDVTKDVAEALSKHIKSMP